MTQFTYCCVVVTILIVSTFVSMAVCFRLKRPARQWCMDRNGIRRSLGEEWREIRDRVMCRCEYPESHLYFWDGTDPSDATPFCLLNGCRDSTTGRFLTDGNTFMNERGYLCTCLRGTDPYLMDAYTLFHTECSLVLPEVESEQTVEQLDRNIFRIRG